MTKPPPLSVAEAKARFLEQVARTERALEQLEAVLEREAYNKTSKPPRKRPKP